MRTLYLRNVPDDVAEGLEQLAQRSGMSLNAFAVNELRNVARRARNAALLESLPDTAVTTAEILDVIDESRRER